MSWFKVKTKTHLCPKHGEVTEVVKLKNLGELDGLYCGKCRAEMLARELCRVLEVEKG